MVEDFLAVDLDPRVSDGLLDLRLMIYFVSTIHADWHLGIYWIGIYLLLVFIHSFSVCDCVYSSF